MEEKEGGCYGLDFRFLSVQAALVSNGERAMEIEE